jgi:hypothetical protein
MEQVWRQDWRLRLIKYIYALMALRHLGLWWSERRYRLLQAKLQFSGGNTLLDKN